MGESAPNALQNVLFALAEDLLRKAGAVRFVAGGGSMLPAILPGDELVVQSVHWSDIQVGDTVLFQKQGRWFAHRVFQIERSSSASSILTRGDALPAPDAPVTPGELLGRVRGVLRDGVIRLLPSPNSISQTILRAGVRYVPHFAGLYLRWHNYCSRPFPLKGLLARTVRAKRLESLTWPTL